MHADRAYAPLVNQAFHLVGRLLRIGDERIRLVPGNKRAIGPVAAVGEPFTNKLDSADRPLLEPRARETDHGQAGEGARRYNGVRISVFPAGLVI